VIDVLYDLFILRGVPEARLRDKLPNGEIFFI
jgi:hypothetical protein